MAYFWGFIEINFGSFFLIFCYENFSFAPLCSVLFCGSGREFIFQSLILAMTTRLVN